MKMLLSFIFLKITPFIPPIPGFSTRPCFLPMTHLCKKESPIHQEGIFIDIITHVYQCLS